MHALTPLALLAIACLPLHAVADKPTTAQLCWMVGAWEQKTDKETVTEIWQGPAGGLMVASNLTRRASGRAGFEFLRIVETPTGLSYLAMPGAKPATEFKMKELGEKKIVFENPEHEFPARILYWRDGEALMARTEGRIAGAERAEEWRFERKAPFPACP